jgi:hypothetical protein
MIPGDSFLAIYLNDHLGGATGGLELARRIARENPDGELGAFLRRLATEIAEDREELIKIMEALGVGKDRAKVAGGWAAEKVGRLKLNGKIVGYSPLSRVLELEGLEAGVTGKLALWRSLEATGRLSDEWRPVLVRLREQAEAQREELELEGLIAGVNGKLALWHSLIQVAPAEPRLDAEHLEQLAQRAERQIEELRRHHRPAAAEAFVGELSVSR